MKYNYGSYQRKLDNTTQWYIYVKETDEKLCELCGPYNTGYAAEAITKRLNSLQDI